MTHSGEGSSGSGIKAAYPEGAAIVGRHPEAEVEGGASGAERKGSRINEGVDVIVQTPIEEKEERRGSTAINLLIISADCFIGSVFAAVDIGSTVDRFSTGSSTISESTDNFKEDYAGGCGGGRCH